jgi:hypothetical protein
VPVINRRYRRLRSIIFIIIVAVPYIIIIKGKELLRKHSGRDGLDWPIAPVPRTVDHRLNESGRIERLER